MREVWTSGSSLPDMIEAVRAQGGLIHDLPPAATQELAIRHQLYTTTEPRNPGTFTEFRRSWERDQAFISIARNVGAILGKTEQYQDAVRNGILGEHLVAAFGGITRIECDDVHLVPSHKAPKGQKGIVAATETRLTIPDATYANGVGVAIQGLLSTGSLETFYPVSVDTQGRQGATVTIGRLDEHAARSLSRSVEAVVAQEDKRQGVTLPPDKRTYADWRARGETFPHLVDQRLRKAEAAYEQLEIAGTYRGRPDLAPRPKPRIIGNDAAAFFEGIRDIFNGLIHAPDVRGGSHHNLEQHPDKKARPLIEADIDLRRDKATLEDVKDGPLPSRPVSLTEKGLDGGREKIEAARRQPLDVIALGISSALSLPATMLDVSGSAIKYLPAGGRISQRFANVHKEWQRQQVLAAAGGERLDKIAARLRRIEQGLIIWE